MIYRITSPQITGAQIDLPSSKSISNRLLLLGVLSRNTSAPDNLSESDDTRAMLSALEGDCSTIDVGAAGTSMRFLTAYLATLPGEHVITGSERMKRRPIALLVEALRTLGATIEYVETEGFPPLKITGRQLTGNRIELSSSVSSQYISAIMMIAPLISGGLQIHLTGKIISRPYIDMTLKIMQLYGIECAWIGNMISISEGKYTPRHTTVESDWSAASYWYTIAALSPGCEFELKGLKLNSLQGDSATVSIGAELGIETRETESGVVICAKNQVPERFDYDFNNQPDLAQTFVMLCCLKGVKFCFTGLESLKIKETDRIQALVDEAAKLGFVLETNNVDMLQWSGQTCRQSVKAIKTYKDHRMAMAFAPAALRFSAISIDDPMVVTKSYPNFWSDLQSVGFKIETL